MGQDSKIEWTNHTFNPWMGCAKIHTGCTHCYAEAFTKRYGKSAWGANTKRVMTSPTYWKQPIKWNREAQKSGTRARVFCASLADVFEDREDLKLMREGLFSLIDATPWLDWLLLTKRPEHIKRLWTLHHNGRDPCDHLYLRRENVWLGTSVSDQETAEEMLPHLLRCRYLAPVLFASYEPAVGPIRFNELQSPHHRDGLQYSAIGFDDRRYVEPPGYLDWIIVGGESGPGARPCRQTWVRDTVRQCADYGVACFVKQLGSNAEEGFGVNRKLRLADSKGGDPAEWPEDIRVQQFPELTPADV